MPEAADQPKHGLPVRRVPAKPAGEDGSSGNAGAKPGKSLTGFYVAMGVVALLVGLFAILWTPLSVRYWERQVRVRGGLVSFGVGHQKVLMARKLAAIGPPAKEAFRRLLQDKDEVVRKSALVGLDAADPRWALPLLVETCERENDKWVRLQIVSMAEQLSGEQFDHGEKSVEERLDRSPKEFLAWWEREGQAKYARGEK